MISRTLDDKHWLVLFVLDNGPLQVYHYDRENGRAEFPFTYQCVRWTALAKIYPVVIKSRDWQNLVSYYTPLPILSDTDGDDGPESPLPTILRTRYWPTRGTRS